MQDETDGQGPTTNVGAVDADGDLRIWRAREALRHGEVRLGVQAQANQALESRAVAILGWSVAAVLALGAAVVNRTHAIAAGLAACGLIAAALLCIVAIVEREWIGPGYRPEMVLNDSQPNELLAIESLVVGYIQAVESNHQAFTAISRMLNWALGFIIAAPVLGGIGLLMGR